MRTIAYTALIVWMVGLAANERCRGDEGFSLVIDPFTGSTSLRNDAATTVALDSYFVTSPGNPVLNPLGPSGWDSLTENGVPGWHESFSTIGDRLGEVNLFESLTFSAGESVGIGSAYVPFSPSAFGEAEPGLNTLNFSYTLANESVARVGDVEFSARNTLLLVIDPDTGAASIENRSDFNVNIDSYLIKSSESVLDVGSWSPLADADSNWFSSTGAANRLAEANLFGATMLSSGGSLSIGSPVDPVLLDDETDLELEFTIAGFGSLKGGVLFATSTAVDDADFDTDGDVDGMDLDLWQDGYGAAGAQVDGDADGNGLVNGRDFLIWQRQYTGPGTLAAAAAVPEPSSMILVLTCFSTFGRRGRQARLRCSPAS